jgi:hypothetical protein
MLAAKLFSRGDEANRLPGHLSLDTLPVTH